MDEDTPLRQVVLSEEQVIPTSSECPKTSPSSVFSTDEKGDKNSAPQLENHYTLDEIMAERYSPMASGNSRSQPTSGNGVDESPTGRRPNRDDKT